MDRQNFKNENQSFPISTDTLDFMQNVTALTAKLTSMAGENYILKQSSSVSDGIIVISGELMPLKGNLDEYIEIVENAEDITAFDVVYQNARIRRYAVYKSVSLSGISAETIPLLDGAKLLQLKESVGLLSQSLNQFSVSLTQVSDSLNNLSDQVQNNYTEFSAHKILHTGTISKTISEYRVDFDINFPAPISDKYLFFSSIRSYPSQSSPVEMVTCRVISKYTDRISIQLGRNSSNVGADYYLDYMIIKA